MKIFKTNIHGLMIIKFNKNKDNRGTFIESYVKKKYKFLKNIDFIQDNYSISKKNVLRGLHYQIKNSQDKLIHITNGKLINFTVDLRKGSPSFLQIFSRIISSDEFIQLFIPKGCANGILSLSNNLILNYKCSDYYNPLFSSGIRWDDPDLDLNWGTKKPILSRNDKNLPFLSKINHKDLPLFRK
tara:strand:+ start:867 stop:1421 length:555 start_codon:yes stop_codon:yes gene_type:complete